MKQETKKLIPATEETIIKYLCDDCKSEGHGHKIKSCMICGKDICVYCGFWWDGYMWNVEHDEPTFNGDYPGRVCKSCWEIGKEYRLKINDIREKAEEDENKLMAEWVDKAKNNIKDINGND